MTLLKSPQDAIAVSRARELAALIFIYEQGIATAIQLGRHVMGETFAPKAKYHCSLLRRLHKRGQVAFTTSPIAGERLYFLTSEGAGFLQRYWGHTLHWLPHVDFHAGRSGITVAHHLEVNNFRLMIEAAGLGFISERIIRAAWGNDIPKIPDALIGMPSTLPYWPDAIPVALEYENSPRSETRRLLMLSAAQKLIGKRVASILVVANPGAVQAWRKTLAKAEAQPRFEALGRSGKQILHLDPRLLPFWSVTTTGNFSSSLQALRTAHRTGEQAPCTWATYKPWLGLRKAIQGTKPCGFKLTPSANTYAAPMV